MRLEEGMYVRTQNGIFIVSHINTIFDDDDYKKVCLCQNEKVAFASIETISKLNFSHNIIEILELGDLIEVECEKGNTNVFEVVAIDYENNEVGIFNNNFNIDFCSIEQIKSIVTKEMFDNSKFKVGE